MLRYKHIFVLFSDEIVTLKSISGMISEFCCSLLISIVLTPSPLQTCEEPAFYGLSDTKPSVSTKASPPPNARQMKYLQCGSSEQKVNSAA